MTMLECLLILAVNVYTWERMFNPQCACARIIIHDTCFVCMCIMSVCVFVHSKTFLQ